MFLICISAVRGHSRACMTETAIPGERCLEYGSSRNSIWFVHDWCDGAGSARGGGAERQKRTKSKLIGGLSFASSGAQRCVAPMSTLTRNRVVESNDVYLASRRTPRTVAGSSVESRFPRCWWEPLTRDCGNAERAAFMRCTWVWHNLFGARSCASRGKPIAPLCAAPICHPLGSHRAAGSDRSWTTGLCGKLTTFWD